MKFTRKSALFTTVIGGCILGQFSFANQNINQSCSVAAPSVTFEANVADHTMISHIPHAVKAMSDLGKFQEHSIIPVMFALKLNNESDLDNQISEMYRVGSPTFHQFLTPAQFTARYSPTEQQIAQEKEFLESNGIAVQSVSANRVFINAQASIATLNQVFKTEIHEYVHSSGKHFFAPAYDLQIPNQSQIGEVVGVNNLARLQSNMRVHKATHTVNTVEGSAPGGGLAPADVIKAYNIPSSATGAGETLALFELDGYATSDIQAYEDQFGLPHVPLENVYVDGATGAIGSSDASGEVTLDIEMMVGLVPHAKNILVYEGPSADGSGEMTAFELGYLHVMQKIADDNRAREVSTSWGTTESNFGSSDMKAEGVVYKQMASQGQTVFAASGDSGAEDDGSTLSVQNPGSQPYVVSVGGTTMTIDSSGAWQSEVTWNSEGGGGGGGISKVWSIPAWQSKAISGDKQASKTMRNLPDVSLNSDPDTGFAMYQGGWQVAGGTSAAAPLWAAFNALANQARLAKNLTPTGFLTSALYAIGESSKYDAGFIDIVKGTNAIGSASAGMFTAYKGYDNATGWGSFRGGLIGELATDPIPSITDLACMAN